MALVNVSKLQNVIPEFIDSQLMPSAPSEMKWILGGATFLILQKADVMVNEYVPLGKKLGLVNENNQIDTQLLRGFFNSAFNKSGRLTKFGFTFDKNDGEALVNIMERYRDD
jgi:hypothetical protein